MKDRLRSIAVAAITSTLVAVVASADSPPDQLMQQGRVVVAGTPLEGDHQVTFRVYDGSGDELHEETETVTFRGGYYAQAVGTGASGFLSAFTSGTARFVGIAIDGAAELTPRQPIVSVPYAIASYSVEGGPVTASSLAVRSGAIDTPVVDATGHWVGVGRTVPCASCVGAGEVTDETLTGAEIQNGTLTGADVQDGTIADADIVGGVVSGTSITTVISPQQPTGNPRLATATCPANSVVLGGGCEIESAAVAAESTRLWASRPYENSWQCVAVTTDPATPRPMVAYAICGSTQ